MLPHQAVYLLASLWALSAHGVLRKNETSGSYPGSHAQSKLSKRLTQPNYLGMCPNGTQFNPNAFICEIAQPPTTQTKTSPIPISKCKRRICYFNADAKKRMWNARQTVKDLDPSLCTHIFYYFAPLKGSAIKAKAPMGDISEGDYQRVIDLKKRNPDLKVFLSVREWDRGPFVFTSKMSSKNIRVDFARNAITFLRDRGFDGLDLYWMFPKGQDREAFSLLVKALKSAFISEASASGKPRLLLTCLVLTERYQTTESAYDVPVLNSELDFILLKSYGIRGSSFRTVGLISPLYASSNDTGDDATKNVDWVVKHWVEKGISPEKLVVGVGLYGLTYILASAKHTGPGSRWSGYRPKGIYTQIYGFMAHYEICEATKKGAKYNYVKEQESAYSVVAGNVWIGYENSDSLRAKVRYIRQNNYGGIFVWESGFDDFKGEFCGKGPYPLLNAIKNACEA